MYENLEIREFPIPEWEFEVETIWVLFLPSLGEKEALGSLALQKKNRNP